MIVIRYSLVSRMMFFGSEKPFQLKAQNIYVNLNALTWFITISFKDQKSIMQIEPGRRSTAMNQL